MGVWAEVKHALNSTIGTNNFKPLNELILDSIYLTATDDVLYSIGDVMTSENEETVFEKTAECSGAVKITGEILNDIGRYNNIKIYLNGTLNKTLTISNATIFPQSLVGNVQISKGDVLKITTLSDRTSRINDVSIRGTIIPAPSSGNIFN